MAEPDHRSIAEQLKAEADRYEPDLDRIRQRIGERKSDRTVRRSAWLLPAAAAACVILAAAGVITAVQGETDPGPDAAVQVSGAATPSSGTPAGTPTGTQAGTQAGTPTGTPTGTQAGIPPASTTSRPADPARSAPAPSTPVSGSGAGVSLKSVAVESDQVVTVPGGALDWVAAGDTPDQPARRRQGDQVISGPHLHGDPTATTTTGPFAVSWTGGMPANTRTGSRNWLSVTGRPGGPETGLILTVPVTGRATELVLYLGAGEVDGRLRAKLGRQPGITRATVRADGQGHVVTLRRAAGADDVLTVELLAGSGGAICLAAAVLH